MDSSGNGTRVGREIWYTKNGNSGEETVDTDALKGTEPETTKETVEQTVVETSTVQETEPIPEPEPSQEGSEPPILTMTTDQVTLAVGTSFIYQDYVESIVDDKDPEDELFRELIIEGEYNIQTPGTYPLVFYTCDSDGNISNKVPLTVIVQ